MKTDLKKFIDENIEDLAESHIECWVDRYRGKSKENIKYDLYTNHDNCLEIERAEEGVKRKLTNEEIELFIDKFNKKVLSLLDFEGCVGIRQKDDLGEYL